MTSKLSSLRRHQLHYLDALLTFGSVTRAARHTRVSQPTMSVALAQLRAHYNDELLIRVGNHHELTPLAAALQPMVAQACTSVERIFNWGSEFDLEHTEREFSLVSSDFGGSVLGQNLLSIMQADAPGSRLRVIRPTLAYVHRARESLRTVDGMLMPRDILSELPHLDLLHDEWVCIADRRNDKLGEDVTLDDLMRLPWVATDLSVPIAAYRALELMGAQPRSVARTDSFILTAALVRGSDRIAIIQGEVAHAIAEQFELRVIPCPFSVPPITLSLWWHPTVSNDEGHKWWRECFRRASEAIGPANEFDH